MWLWLGLQEAAATILRCTFRPKAALSVGAGARHVCTACR